MTKNASPASVANIISFQGEPGANSQMACHEAFPGMETLACPTFEEAFAAVEEGRARLAMIPVENSVSGRVADIHHLLPESGLYINGEHFFRVHHQLLGIKGATLAGIRTVRSQLPALGQCRKLINELKLTQISAADTAGSARQVAEAGDPTAAALASTSGGGNLRPGYFACECGGSGSQHHAVPDHVEGTAGTCARLLVR